MENKKLNVFQNQFGQKWFTWLNSTFEENIFDLEKRESVSPLVAEGWTKEESETEFVKQLAQAVLENRISIFAGIVTLPEKN